MSKVRLKLSLKSNLGDEMSVGLVPSLHVSPTYIGRYLTNNAFVSVKSSFYCF
jgi:hypothetical protein